MNKKISISAGAIAASLLLTACGGGGGGDAPTPYGNAAVIYGKNTGNVSARLASSTAPKYILMGKNSFATGVVSTFVQDSDGVIVTLNSNVLTGSPNYAAQQISGDTNFAQARWTLGKLTQTSSVTTLTGNDDTAFHYVLYTPLATLPTSGVKVCGPARSTDGTYVSGTNIGDVTTAATVTASNANLSFGPTGVSIQATVNATVGAATASDTYNGFLAAAAASTLTGGFWGGGTKSGASLGVGDGGGGTITLVVPFASMLSNGARYQGILTMNCA